MGEPPSTSIHEHPVRCTGGNRSCAHGWAPDPSSIHKHPARCAGRSRSWVHGRAPHPRASKSTMCSAQVECAHGPMGERPIHEHPGAYCAPQVGIAHGSIGELPIHEHPRSPRALRRDAPRGPMGEHPIHEHPRQTAITKTRTTTKRFTLSAPDCAEEPYLARHAMAETIRTTAPQRRARACAPHGLT